MISDDVTSLVHVSDTFRNRARNWCSCKQECASRGFKYITKTRLFKYIENFTSKTEKCQMKNSDIFHISAQNIDCGYSFEPPRRGGSNEYPQSMFLSRNKKNNVYPCKPQFYYIKVGFKGVKIIEACFRNDMSDFSCQIYFP